MNIDHHISELLYDHDCVIVPGFGGFLASYSPARIHPVQHTLTPPSKKIAFNIFLRQNDGLLAARISGEEKLSYNEALRQIEHLVFKWQKELSEGRKIVIECIGTLHLDEEKNLQFDPVRNINYLRDSFGMSTIQFLPVNRESGQQHTEVQPKLKRKGIRSIETGSIRKKAAPVGKGQRILSAVIVSGTLIWLSFVFRIVSPQNPRFSSLNPFSSGTKTEQKIISTSPEVELKQPVKPVPISVTAPDTAKTYAASDNNKIKEAQAGTPVNQLAAAVPVIPSLTENKQKYFVIGGAFQVRGNADAFVKSLQEEGFPEARILDTSRNLKMVCFGGFATFAEAANTSDSLNALSKSAWVFRR